MPHTDLTTPSKHRRAFLIGLALPGQPDFVVEEHLDELAELTASDGLEVVGRTRQQRKAPDAATFIGRGKAAEAATAARHLGAEVIIFDDDLSPKQARNLEEIFDLPVADRSGLILDIFAARARTREARTQVELAQLNYLLPRLARRWAHLSRQVGGIGVRGGEGETQLEADRRMVRTRIRALERELQKIERSREVQRRGRRGAEVITLAGYTNAGKSTLFNALTRAGVRAENRLFATLDSRLRRGSLDGARTAVFADTVGFIRKLPHHLVASFRSTLGEIAHGDLVLHVVDRSHSQWREQMEIGDEVLRGMGVEAERIVHAFNKADRLGGVTGAPSFSSNGSGQAVWVSALTGEGLDALRAELLTRLEGVAA